MEQLEERRQKRIDKSPPCNPANPPQPEALLQPMMKRKGLIIIFDL
jgi:hypothetical protein